MNYTKEFVIIFYLLNLIISIHMQNKLAKMRKTVFIIQLIGFALLFGLRSNKIGVDTKHYLDLYFNEYVFSNISFTIYNKILMTFFGKTQQLYIFFVTVPITLLFGIAYYMLFKDSKRLNISLMILATIPYFILFNINVVRQGLGLSLMLLGCVLWFEGKKKLSIVLLLFSMTFHQSLILISSLAFLIMYFDFSMVILVGFILVSFILSCVHFDVFLVNFMPEAIQDRYAQYSVRTDLISFNVIYIYYLIHFLALIIINYFSNNRKFKFLLKISTVFLIIPAFFSNAAVFGTRFLIGIDCFLPALYICFINDFLDDEKYKYVLHVLYTIFILIVFNLPPIVINFNW